MHFKLTVLCTFPTHIHRRSHAFIVRIKDRKINIPSFPKQLNRYPFVHHTSHIVQGSLRKCMKANQNNNNQQQLQRAILLQQQNQKKKKHEEKNINQQVHQ